MGGECSSQSQLLLEDSCELSFRFLISWLRSLIGLWGFTTALVQNRLPDMLWEQVAGLRFNMIVSAIQFCTWGYSERLVI